MNDPSSTLHHSPDPENMLGHIDALAEELGTAHQLGTSLPLPKVPKPQAILICGMGGSAIGGDFVASYLAPIAPLPIISWRNYGLPAWAQGEQTLVICSSHSGNTEETLSNFSAAIEQGCSLMTISTGGKLSIEAHGHDKTSWIFKHIGQPRTAIAYSFGLILSLVERLGLIRLQDNLIAESIAVLEAGKMRLGAGSDPAYNPATRMAKQLVNKNMVVFGAGGMEVIARRWKTQINELAKAWCSFEGIPEMNHNTLAGLLYPPALLAQSNAFFLRSKADHLRNALRIDASMESFRKCGMQVEEFFGQGESQLAQMWSLLQFGDYLSYYLALEYGVDPTPVNALLQLKEKLAHS